MGIKLSTLSDEELGAMVRSRYAGLAAAHDAGMCDEHPRDAWNRDSATLREYREAAASGGVPGKIAGSDSASREAAEDDQIRLSGSSDIGGDLALASARRSNPARIRAMAKAIPGYIKPR